MSNILLVAMFLLGMEAFIHPLPNVLAVLLVVFALIFDCIQYILKK